MGSRNRRAVDLGEGGGIMRNLCLRRGEDVGSGGIGGVVVRYLHVCGLEVEGFACDIRRVRSSSKFPGRKRSCD